jgi:glycerol-3-phosphate dehydrogenase (NAD(P)+)
MKTGILGGGSWAIALMKVLCEKAEQNSPISWCLRKESDVEHILKHKHHARYLPSVTLDTEKINFLTSPEALLKDNQIVILAVPSAFLHHQLQHIPVTLFRDKFFFSAIKGIVPEHLLIVGEYLQKVYGVPSGNIGVLTGPCHAEEVAQEKLSYLTVASENETLRKYMSDYLRCDYLQTIPSDDIYGTELAAVLKNVYAIAGGICLGLGFGDNFLAVLVSYALQEMEFFIRSVHPISRDIHASAYLGDLLVTTYSPFSRNRAFGLMIGKGYSVKNAREEMNMVAEGYYASACIEKICREKNIELKLANIVYRILYENAPPRKTMENILPCLN